MPIRYTVSGKNSLHLLRKGENMTADTIKMYLKYPRKLIIRLGRDSFLKLLNDEAYLKLIYRANLHKKLNLNDPQSFNEKLQWLKIHDRNPLYTQLVDKYEVRNYIADKIGEEYLIPLLGVWERFDDIDFDKLPNQFVLKCTHDSGGLVICKDKSKLDLKAARRKINKGLKRNYYWTTREWPYKNVKPRIIAEKYMVDESGYELKDYKFMCFNGIPKCLFVCLNRKSPGGLNVDFYDCNWNPMPFERKYKNSGTTIAKPKSFDKMLEISRQLALPFVFMRVDLYEINGMAFFGELTFYPGNGMEDFRPEEWDYMLGNWIKIPKE